MQEITQFKSDSGKIYDTKEKALDSDIAHWKNRAIQAENKVAAYEMAEKDEERRDYAPRHE